MGTSLLRLPKSSATAAQMCSALLVIDAPMPRSGSIIRSVPRSPTAPDVWSWIPAAHDDR